MYKKVKNIKNLLADKNEVGKIIFKL